MWWWKARGETVPTFTAWSSSCRKRYVRPKGACLWCPSPVLGRGMLAGSLFLPQMGLQGCPGPASAAVLGRAPLGVGHCPIAELPHPSGHWGCMPAGPVFTLPCEQTGGHFPAGRQSLAFSRAVVRRAKRGMVCADAEKVSNCLPLAPSRSST